MRKSSYRERGFSLVELMVGIAIGLIVLLIMSQVLSIQSAQKQTTSGGSNAQTSGAIALFMLERDARMAGFGINGAPLLGCKVNAYLQEASSGAAFNFTFVPVRITAGADSDTLEIAYGTSDGNLSPAKLAANHSGDTADYQLDNRFGFHEGDMFIIGQDGLDADGDGVNDCALAQVTALPGAAGQMNNIRGSGNSYTDPGTAQPAQAKYNKPGGAGIAYASGARVYNVGAPVSHAYSVDAGSARLMLRDAMSGGASQPIADSIVMLRARYGKDADGDGSIDTYDAVTPSSAAEWARVIGLRVAVVARSARRESGVVSDASIKLWPDLELASGAVAEGPSMALSEEQRHYRYRVFQTLVPLRNLIWTIPANS